MPTSIAGLVGSKACVRVPPPLSSRPSRPIFLRLLANAGRPPLAPVSGLPPPSTIVPRQLIGLLVSRSVLRISISDPPSVRSPPAEAFPPVLPLRVEFISRTESWLFTAPPSVLALLPLKVQLVHVNADCT